MSNGKSRAKGKRGELGVMHKLGGSAKRVGGHSFVSSPGDVETDLAIYQVKNNTVGGSEIALELRRLEAITQKNTYVVFKVKGKWYVAETLGQHVDDHGDVPVEDKSEGE